MAVLLKKKDVPFSITNCYEIASLLKLHSTNQAVKEWFFLFARAQKEAVAFTNAPAWASAFDYVWSKHNGYVAKQKELAEQYNVSVSTLRKYVKKVEDLMGTTP
jgi:hypothetical protein